MNSYSRVESKVAGNMRSQERVKRESSVSPVDYSRGARDESPNTKKMSELEETIARCKAEIANLTLQKAASPKAS